VRLVTFGPRGLEEPGALLDEEIVPLRDLLPDREAILTDDDVLASLPALEEVVAAGAVGHARVPLADVRLGPPVRRPSKIIEVGFNTWSLLRAAGTEPFSEPALYAKAPNAVTGPYDDVVRPDGIRKLDYEMELAVVIARRCRSVPRADALAHVAGVTVANDVTARDMQLGEGEGGRYHRQNYHSKSFDTFCPLGPCLVTGPDLPGRLEDLTVRTYVNGELRQEGSVGDLVSPVAELIEFVSSGMTLEAGDVLLTGSPAGAGYLMDPPRYLVAGDVVTGVVDGIGRIENGVRDEADG
jgi:2-keto-4-pentenoate hydratase/2-oxohepta-3-ene-1,7-dioic acid hydratase in catechol pathway